MIIRRALAVALLLLATAGCGNDEPTSAGTGTDRLEVVSWWTSGSEAAALDTVLAAFRQANPGVDAVNGAVAGGAGSQAIVALAKRLQRDDPPDVWQTFAGQSVQGYAQRGAVREVSSVYAAGGLDTAMQPTIRAAMRRDGRPYGVPTGSHRSNVLWFNPAVLARAGVPTPTATYSVAMFLADLEKVKAVGVAPLCLGGRDPFTTVELFENVLLSTIGAVGWRAMAADGLDWRSDRVDAALRSFGRVLAYADPAAGGLTWDAATRKLTTGECAFESMNDSAYGELVAGGARDGREFAAVPFPGTDGSYLAVVDVFVAATKAKNAKNALGFLGAISQPAVQVPFHQAKGSVPVLRNVDVAALSPYQQNASKSLWNEAVLLSVAHGESMSPEFQEGFYNAVSAYVRTRDPGAFATELEDAVSQGRIPPR
jgi:glucose/mannose transport system substrate-binding protein